MESITFHGSPLATEYEGEGQHDAMSVHTPTSESGSSKMDSPSFAPRRHPRLRLRSLDLPKPVRVAAPNLPPLDELRDAISRVVSASTSRTENARFIEHFRYLIIASQLLSEQTSGGSHIPNTLPHIDRHAAQTEYRPVSITLTGVAVTSVATFGLVWLIHWSRNRSGSLSKSKLSLTIITILLTGFALHKYSRRQDLQFLRQEVVSITNTLITNLLAFEASSRAALVLIQDVEVVSRGLHISDPMPPITRIESSARDSLNGLGKQQHQPRHCLRLRQLLAQSFAHVIPLMLEACTTMRHLVKEADLERYLGIYEITPADLQDAALPSSPTDLDDPESLETLRLLRRKLSILRIAFLCSLLAVEADGTQADLVRWRGVVSTAGQFAILAGKQASEIQQLLNEEDTPALPSPRSSVTPIPLARKRAYSQARKLSSLSRGVRDLQGKVQLLREDSIRMLENETSAEEIAELSKSLMAQYEALGLDLKSLMNAWEQGKSSLAINISKSERRISQRSSGLRSPAPSLGGLTAVDCESEGSPVDALRALNGEIMKSSRRSSASISGLEDREDYEEVYEAIALPKVRRGREERLRRVEEDVDVEGKSLLEQRLAEDRLMKELVGVIGRRPARVRGGSVGQ